MSIKRERPAIGDEGVETVAYKRGDGNWYWWSKKNNRWVEDKGRN